MSDENKPQSNESMIKMVVFAVAVDASIGVAVLGYCLITAVKPDPTLLTAYVGLTGTLSGYLGGMLTKTTPTQSVAENKPIEAKVVNTKSDPVQTEDADHNKLI